MLFPILILPIVARKLGAETFGLTEYATSIASYFILLSSLGIYNYGSREVSILYIKKFKKLSFKINIGIILFITTCFYRLINNVLIVDICHPRIYE